jgi:hypothetical protein
MYIHGPYSTAMAREIVASCKLPTEPDSLRVQVKFIAPRLRIRQLRQLTPLRDSGGAEPMQILLRVTTIEGLGFRVEGLVLGFMVWGLGFAVWILGFVVWTDGADFASEIWSRPGCSAGVSISPQYNCRIA